MKTKHQISKALSAAMLAAALFLSSSAVFAQVKIGTNPTVIGATNNLEVEASTAGNKVSVDKTTGKVTIADGSQGAAKVLTSDANGVATWTAPAAQTSPVQVKIAASGAQYIAGASVNNTITLGTTVFDVGSNKVGNTVVIPSSGLYEVTAAAQWQVSGAEGGGWAMRLFLNGVFNDQFAGSAIVNNIVDGANGRIVTRLTAGQIVSLVMVTQQNNGSFLVNNASLTIIKLSN